jgi:hypothetical protein
MDLFKSKDEREAARAVGDQHRLQAHQAIEKHLVRAVEAADRGDVLGEEQAIANAFRMARSQRDWGTRSMAEQHVTQLMNAGRIRRSHFIGHVGDVHIWKDRINCFDEGRVHLLDERVRASVETAGQLVQTQRPTLTRMAIGSVLPGTALIPGFAFQKKDVQDTRELFFVLEHPEWARLVKVEIDLEGTVREIAIGVNQAAGQIAFHGSQRQADLSRPEVLADPLDRLKKLVELRDRGVLSPAEFDAQKAKIFGGTQ